MTIRLMRSIDYWLGIPLCFLLSVVGCIEKLFVFMKKEKDAPEKILFIKLSEMGSIILAYPLINKLRNAYPQAKIYFLTFNKNKPLLEILKIGEIFTIREERLIQFTLDTLRLIKRMKREKIDIVLDLEFFSRFTAILTYLSGANKRIGFYRYTMEGLYRGNLLTHRLQYNGLIHISKVFLSLYQVVKGNNKLPPELKEKIEGKEISLPKYIISEEGKRQVWDKLRRFDIEEGARLLLINPGEGNISLREWPLENFIILARRLLEDQKNYILIVGLGGAVKKAQALSRLLGNRRCLDLTQKTTLPEVLSLFNVAEALITNDSGLAHLTSLTTIKKFVLFGPESPRVYAPLGNNTWIIYSGLPCSPCLSAFNHRESACKDNQCLKIIKPGEVYELIQVRLKAGI